MAYSALICQGDTNSASDCNEIGVGLVQNSNYPLSNLIARGFTRMNNTPHTNFAGVGDFKDAKNYDILYWSSHGSSSDSVSPQLNVVKGPPFYSGNTAYSDWRGTNKLKVVLLAACYQLDGDPYRARWANNIMRKTNIRVICGYHDQAPAANDDKIAKKFMDLCAAGNSVMYSWKNANSAYSNGGNYCILVYNEGNRQYYRLPGFPGNTYADPDPNSTKIYRYTSVTNGGNISMSSAANVSNITVPYTLNMAGSACRQFNPASLIDCIPICTDVDQNAMFYAVRENCLTPTTAAKVHGINQQFLANLLQDSLDGSCTRLESLNDVRAEVPIEGAEGPEEIIGGTTRIFQQHNGILLEGNCVVATSDDEGIIGFTSSWQDIAAANGADHIDLINGDLKIAQAKFTKNSGISAIDTVLQVASPRYIRKGDQYVLHYDLQFEDGARATIDAKQLGK